MKITIGIPASGDNYFLRKNLIEDVWESIESGFNILLVAPRRVGKTSLLYYLKDNAKDGYSFLYLDTESVNNENEFFRKVVNKVMESELVKKSQRIITFFKENLPTIKKVGVDGVEFGISDELNYKELLINILKSIDPDNGKLVIMLDEFSQTLANIIEDEGDSAGKRFLQSNRELRMDNEFAKRVQFIYTGSIGLENIASGINSIAAVNDLSRVKTLPLQKDEAVELFNLILNNQKFDLSETIIEYILEKIEWLIPFNIQLVLHEIKNINREENPNEITEEIVERAFQEMIEQRNYFEHWHTRLRTFFKGGNYNFAKELLNIISEHETINSNEINDTAEKHELKDDYKDIVNFLIHDGYINNSEDNNIYRFNFPVLKEWWRKYVAN